MRRLWIAVLVVAVMTAAACAHPTEDPLPGETATTSSPDRPSTSTPTGADQTEEVCEEALERSNEVVAEIEEKIGQAQANPATATATLLALRTTATEWKEDLQEYAERPIRGEVRDALNEGVEVIDEILAMPPQELANNADQAQEDIEGFIDDLERACA